MTHICVNKITIIGSDNGLSPGRRQAIIWTNAELLLIRPLGTNFSEILIEILTFPFKKMRLKVSSAKRRPFCLGLNVLTAGLCPRFPSTSSHLRCHLTSIGNPIIKIRRFDDRLISIMEFPTMVRWHDYIESRPGVGIISSVASMPAVRYDLSGGLPTCLWLFIYQDYSVICISKKLM